MSYRTFGGREGDGAGDGVAFRPAAARPQAPGSASLAAGPGLGLGPGPEKALLGHGVLTPRNVLLLTGTLTLQLVVVPPVWDAARLLDDPAFGFFLGGALPAWTIAACLLAVLAYALAVAVFFRFARAEFRTELTLVMIATAVITALGLALLALSRPVMHDSATARQELFFNCQYGEHTQPLAQQYAALQHRRAAPECAAQESIEQCAGFEGSYLTGVLKDFEAHYQCAGFCAGWSTNLVSERTPAAAAAGNDSDADSGGNRTHASLVDDRLAVAPGGPPAMKAPRTKLAGALQRLINKQRAQDLTAGARSGERGGGASLLELELEVNEGNSSRASAAQPGKLGAYPPTLFSRANYQVSCDGAAGRALKYQAETAGQTLFWEGVVLLVVAMLAGVLNTGGFCMGDGERAKPLAAAMPRQLVF